jgi:DNA polymerase-3 subunit delta'
MFTKLAGNQRVKDLLKRMLESGRVPGALLFSGEEGIGKKLFAVELAKALNCRAPIGIEACDQCATCVRISKFNYPQSDKAEEWDQIIRTDHADVGLVVAPKRVLKVEQMRAIEREANYRPFEGKARVFLVDDAEKLNDSSANALLKILEEPPRTSHIVLITARPAILLPTIHSRCQVIRFSPVTISEIEEYLLRHKSIEATEARLRARLAGGSIARALASDVERFRSQREVMLQVLEALAVTGSWDDLLSVAEQLSDTRHKDSYEASLDILEALIRDAWLLRLGAPDERVVNDDLRPRLLEISRRLTSPGAALWISRIEELREQLAVNINRKVATDALFLSLATGTH